MSEMNDFLDISIIKTYWISNLLAADAMTEHEDADAAAL